MSLDVSVIVLSYDRPELLERALRSIAGQSAAPREVIVVDNPSRSSDEVRRVVSAFPQIRLVTCPENLGFTGGMNAGLAEAVGEYVYLTEDDIELAPDCLEKLIGFMKTAPDVVLAGPVMWNMATPTIRCAGGDFTFGSVFTMRVTAADSALPPSRHPFLTGFLPGAMIAARTDELRRLGGFHRDFFMYREDVELCARVRACGKQLAIVPDARVFHHDPAPATDSAILTYHKHKNLGALYLLHAPAMTLPLFFVRYVLIDGLRRLIANPAMFPAWLKAWSWVATRSPRLIAERRRGYA